MLVLLVIAVACAAPPGGDSNDLRPDTGTGVIADARYFLSGHQINDEFQAVERLVGKCMRQEGWDYIAGDLVVELFPTEEDSLEIRQRSGYGITDSVENPSESDAISQGAPSPNRLYFLELEEAQRVAYQASKQTCETSALEEFGAWKSEYANSLPDEVIEVMYALETGDHSDLFIGEAEWAACMRALGWAATTRQQFVEGTDIQVRSMFEAGDGGYAEARLLEQRAAVDDWNCGAQHIQPVVDNLYHQLSTALETYRVGLPPYADIGE